MILRRFMKHFSEQNWFAVGLDVLVVIVGVYLGVYIGDAEKDRALQREVIAAVGVLERQLQADLENLDRIIAYRAEKLAQPRTGLAELRKSDPDLAIIDESLFKTYRRVFTFFPNTSGYESLKDRGFLAVLGNAELELKLADLFDRIYTRHLIVAKESDDIAFEYALNFTLMFWDSDNKAFLGDHVLARARLSGALTRTVSNSEWYVEFLSDTVRPALLAALAEIDTYQAGKRNGGDL